MGLFLFEKSSPVEEGLRDKEDAKKFSHVKFFNFKNGF